MAGTRAREQNAGGGGGGGGGGKAEEEEGPGKAEGQGPGQAAHAHAEGDADEGGLGGLQQLAPAGRGVRLPQAEGRRGGPRPAPDREEDGQPVLPPVGQEADGQVRARTETRKPTRCNGWAFLFTIHYLTT